MYNHQVSTFLVRYCIPNVLSEMYGLSLSIFFTKREWVSRRFEEIVWKGPAFGLLGENPTFLYQHK